MKDQETHRVVAVSIETTGLSEHEHEIIEIGAVKLINGVISDQFQAYIKPKTKISESVTKLTGISNQVVASASGIETVLAGFLDFAQDHTIIAHNVEFHLRFLKKAANDLNLQITSSWMDLLTASRVLFPEFKKYDLYSLCNRFGIPTIPIEHQVDEAKACALLYRTLMGEMEDRGIMADAFLQPITPDLIIRHVCKYYGVRIDDLVGTNRTRRIAQPRRVAMYLMRRMTNESYVNIGRLFKRDHASVYGAVQVIEDAMGKDKMLEVSIHEIIANIEQWGLNKSHPLSID